MLGRGMAKRGRGRGGGEGTTFRAGQVGQSNMAGACECNSTCRNSPLSYIWLARLLQLLTSTPATPKSMRQRVIHGKRVNVSAEAIATLDFLPSVCVLDAPFCSMPPDRDLHGSKCQTPHRSGDRGYGGNGGEMGVDRVDWVEGGGGVRGGGKYAQHTHTHNETQHLHTAGNNNKHTHTHMQCTHPNTTRHYIEQIYTSRERAILPTNATSME